MTTNTNELIRKLAVFAIVVPVAIFLGMNLASSEGDPRYSSRVWYSLSLFAIVVCFPLLLKYHHHLLFLSWNMTAVVFFLPGSPNLWLLMSFVSLGMAILHRALVREKQFLFEPSIILPLSFIGVVVLATIMQTGGFNLNIFGGREIGGKRYIMMFAAIAGFFAMTANRIQPEKVNLFVGLFFLSQLTNALGSLAPYFPDALRWFFLIFPIEAAGMAVLTGGADVEDIEMLRPWGLSLAFMSVCYYMLARYGARGVLELKHKWRVLFFFGFALGSLAGGYRTFLVMLGMTFVFLFVLEGLVRSRYMIALALVSVVLSAAILPFANKLPMGIQRTLSLVPIIEVDPVARANAEATSEWRIDMWRRLLPEVPEHLVVGKGLLIDARQQEFAMRLSQVGQASTFGFELAGDYHNGPLSVIIPFGIPGAIGFLWLLWAGFRALWNNFKYGPLELKNVNGLLIALFLSRIVVFFVIFGGFYSDLMHFAGILGLSIAVNGGIHKPERVHSFIRPMALPARLPKPQSGLAQ